MSILEDFVTRSSGERDGGCSSKNGLRAVLQIAGFQGIRL